MLLLTTGASWTVLIFLPPFLDQGPGAPGPALPRSDMAARYKGYTLTEAQEALADAIQARKAAETAQEYANPIGQQKRMAQLEVLYQREDTLRQIVAVLEDMQTTTGSAAACGPVKNYGVYSRR